MIDFLCLVRSVFGIAVIGAMLAGCGGSPSGLGAIPQNAPGYVGSAAQPDIGCGIAGHKYYTGGGHFWLAFAAYKLRAGEHWRRLYVHFHFTKWPFQKPLPDYTTFLTTCGPQTGKTPVGKIIERGGPRTSDKSCHDGICDIYYDNEIIYEPPATIKKAFMYDALAFKFKAKGWGTLKGAKIEIEP